MPPPPDRRFLIPRIWANSRRRLWLIAGIVGLLFATIFAVIVYSDAPEPDTSDLAPRRIELADEENFYVQLSRLAKSLGPEGITPESEPDDLPAGHPARMPAWTSGYEYDDFPDFLAAGSGWTPSRLAKWDSRLAEFASSCEALLRLEKSQAPLPVRVADIYADHELSRIASELPAAAGLYWQAGDRNRALEILAVLYQCGTRIKHSPGSLRTTYVRGAALQYAALRGWRRFALVDSAAADAVHAIWRANRQPELEESLREAMRAEYHNMDLIIADNDGKALRASSPSWRPRPIFFVWIARTRVLFPLVYKPNLTRTIYADHVRAMVETTRLDAATAKRRAEDSMPSLELRDLFHPINLYGRLILLDEDVTRWAVPRRSSYLTEESLLDAVVALRRYHARHGELPDNLSALVPDYLDVVPPDLDGAPLRYTKEHRAVWSISLDGIGKPESANPPSRKSLNQHLDFAMPPDTTPLTPPPAALPAADDSPPHAASASP